MSTAVGPGLLAHGPHAVMVLAGLWGLAALLLPHALTRLAPSSRPPLDAHDRRVAELRAAFAGGTVTMAMVAAVPVAPRTGALSLPLAVVASAAAAGIHAAVALPHLREQALTGTFFLAAAALQLGWAALAATGRPTPALLHAGLVLHLGLVALWLLTRTVGLPLGLQDGPDPVGAWDLTCVVWQLIAVAACARTLRDGLPARLPGWFDWHPSTRAAVGAAAFSLAILALSGAHS